MIVRLVWVIIPLVLIGIVGVQESFAELLAFSDIKNAKHEVDYTILGTISSVGYDGELIKYEATSSQTLWFFPIVLSVDTVYKGNWTDETFTFHLAYSTPDPGKYPIPDSERYKIGENFLFHFKLIDHIGPFTDGYYVLVSNSLGKYTIETVDGIKDFDIANISKDALLAFNSKYSDGIPLNVVAEEAIFKQYSPLKIQLEKGVLPEKIICNNGLELIFKSTDNSPACVKPATAEKLMERGWVIYENKHPELENKSKLRPEGYIPYKTPKISPELQEVLDSEVERVDVRIVLKNTPKPPTDFLKMTDEEQVTNLQERYAQIRMMQKDLVDYITNNDGVVIKQLEFINSVYADVPVTIIDELKNRDDIFTINYYDKDAKAISMPIHQPG